MRPIKFTFIYLFISVLGVFSTQASQSHTLSGYITDASTGEGVFGAYIVVQGTSQGTTADIYGFYSLSLPEGEYAIRFSALGYAQVLKEVKLDQNQKLSLELNFATQKLREAEIKADKNQNIDDTQMGKVGLEMEKIKTLPALFGEVDILKTIQYLPGVQSAGEGNSGFYVRGGGPDQNLILLDNATIYNASHLFGFFSVFNGDAVKNIELTKGGMPARYGGRLSSVLDIWLKEGNSKTLKVDGGLGLIASRLTIQGPLKKDKSSFIISGRRTYIDALAKPFVKPTSNFAGSGYFFYDLNMKVNYTINDKNRIFLSGYFGRDVFNFSSQAAGVSSKIPWGNSMGSFRWNHLFNEKLVLASNVTFSDYRFSFEFDQDEFKFKLFSGIRDFSVKNELTYFASPRHKIKAGVDYVFHRFTPNNVTLSSGDTDFNFENVPNIFAHEGALYVQDEMSLSDGISANVGLRYSYFAQVGEFTRYTRAQSNGFEAPTPPTAKTYGKGELVKAYDGLEPRLSLVFRTTPSSSIKAGYAYNYQYIHLASLSPTGLPTDLWVPSTDVLPPEFGSQYSVGFFKNFQDDTYESSIELYYKNMNNLVEYQEGAGTTPDEQVQNNIDNQLISGTGTSFGAELFIKKTFGKLNGWLGYTWSKTERTFPVFVDSPTFPARFDRRHDLSVVANYQLSKRWLLGGVFVYATGNAITLPVERYFVEGQLVQVYGARNSFRMDPFHRIDISATYTPKNSKTVLDPETGLEIQQKRRIKSSWNFSIYNLYNRKNPYFIYFGNEGDLQSNTLQVKAYQVSLFSILPSVTWNFSF